MIMPKTMLYAGIPTHIPANVPSQKVNPAGSADNPDGTYSQGSYSDISRGFLEKPSLTVRIET
jgi:hypothetical protein